MTRRPDGGYDPVAYWTELHGRHDLSSVGQSALPPSFNAWLYRNGARNLDRFLARHLVAEPSAVYDVGAGTGYWTAYWIARGAGRVDGSDLVPDAVDRLAARFPGTFTVADAAEIEVPGAAYDLVSVMNVLLHITDDARFERALERAAELVAPGGHLLLAEPIVRDPRDATPAGRESRCRVVAAYSAPLDRAGLRLVAVEPTTAIGADPIDRRTAVQRHVWPLAWRGSCYLARRGRLASGLAGRAIWALDPLLLRLGVGASGKFALYRREPA